MFKCAFLLLSPSPFSSWFLFFLRGLSLPIFRSNKLLLVEWLLSSRVKEATRRVLSVVIQSGLRWVRNLAASGIQSLMILSDGFVNILIVVRVHNRGVKVYDWYWSNIRQIRPLGFFLNDREIFSLNIFLAACLIWLFALSSLLLNWLVLSGPTISLGLERPTLLNSIYSVDFIQELA